jgi:hypothetical protein
MAVALLGLVLVAGACGGGGDDDDHVADDSAPGALPSVAPEVGCTGDRAIEDMTCRGLTRVHVVEAPEYPFEPPVGGDHIAVWANCGLYDGVVPPPFAVHSLEHGAIWIAYSTDVTDTELRALDTMVGDDPRLLVSAINDAPAPFVLTAWGVQRYVSSIDEPAVAAFIEAHQDADTAPEAGFACEGGVGEPIRLDDAG